MSRYRGSKNYHGYNPSGKYDISDFYRLLDGYMKKYADSSPYGNKRRYNSPYRTPSKSRSGYNSHSNPGGGYNPDKPRTSYSPPKKSSGGGSPKTSIPHYRNPPPVIQPDIDKLAARLEKSLDKKLIDKMMRKLDEDSKKDKPETDEEKNTESESEATEENGKVEIPDESELIDWKEQTEPISEKLEPIQKDEVAIEQTTKLEADLFEPEDQLEWLREHMPDNPNTHPEINHESFPLEATVTEVLSSEIPLDHGLPLDLIDIIDISPLDDIDINEFLEPLPIEEEPLPEPIDEEVDEV